MTSTTNLLRKILMEGNAKTQSDIQRELKKQGISSSQPKISRLLHQIGAVKLVDSQGKTQYRLPHETGLLHELTSPQEKTFIRQWILDVTANETLIIIHTTPAAAMLVARSIDQNRQNLDVLGTIAGDDTIFIVPKHIKKIAQTVNIITEFLNL
ncbi:MAG: ArgR family transcriptional regulator [Gammaproteobacteria bacterium]|nr:ArgR family transcriptional regulator [Gammaproteobacteria bacterium]